ncbi:hypothetical protein AMS68_001540 [Peltaster fructicola]|uniref:Transcription factor IIIC putative zinc-finger domain-containing protein n=1 Tax=Peltaster fructicola TaxID=286661 RepID=A0A6H0XMS6_9PEZI|nr:hypothetical protein AMS68_001540 [Peltaster fructicola]
MKSPNSDDLSAETRPFRSDHSEKEQPFTYKLFGLSARSGRPTMSTVIKVAFWPACLDNMRWSCDNLIAVAGSESVAVLIPKSRSSSTSSPQWEYITLKVNGYTQAELPLRDPLSFANWSVGEELSARHVIRLEWSPRGLGCFDTCVLAILHSDYVLDLWEYCGQAHIKDSWRRCLIITHAVHDFYETIYPSGEDPSPLTIERQQVRQRVRSIAWAPQLTEDSSEELQSCGNRVLPQTAPLLAIATEAGDILVTRITSPYNTLSPKQRQWKATVLRRICCGTHMPALNHVDGVTFNTTPTSDAYAVMEELVWTQMDGTQEHMLAFIAAGALCTVHVEDVHGLVPSMDAEASRGSTLRCLSPANTRVEGPMSLTADGKSLICFVGDSLVAYGIARSDTEGVHYETHPVNRRWSEVSGLVTIPYAGGATRAVFTTHLGYERLSQDTVLLSATKECAAPITTPIRQSLQQAAKDYRVTMDLGADAHTRTSGIAVAPTSSHIALCTTLLPADSVAHIIQSDHASLIFICELAQSNEHIALNPAASTQQDIIDCIVFSLQAGLATTKDNDPETQPDTRLILDRITSILSKPPPLRDENIDSTLLRSPTAAAMYLLRRKVLDRPDRRNFMQQRLLSCVVGSSYSSLMPRDWYIALIDEYAAIAANLPGGQLSQRIAAMHRLIYNRLQPSGTATSPTAITEYCSVCHEIMPLEAIKWSRCSSGHRFVRCALTFLTIPRPGISKCCGTCGAQYLNEQHLVEFGTGDQPATHSGGSASNQTDTVLDGTDDPGLPALEPAGSAARVLFSVFRRCALCGGRFVA